MGPEHRRFLHPLLRGLQAVSSTELPGDLAPLRAAWMRGGCPGMESDDSAEPEQRLAVREAVLEADKLLAEAEPLLDDDPDLAARRISLARGRLLRAARQLRSAEIALSFHHQLLASVLAGAGVSAAEDPPETDGSLELAAENLSRKCREHAVLTGQLPRVRAVAEYVSRGRSHVEAHPSAYPDAAARSLLSALMGFEGGARG